MTVNKLRLNDSKAEVLLLGPKVQRIRLHFDSLMVGDSEICVPITGLIRNLGAYFGSDLSMNAHVTKVCQAIHLSRDGPPPDFSGIPDFFFFLPPWKKKPEPGKLTIFLSGKNWRYNPTLLQTCR